MIKKVISVILCITFFALTLTGCSLTKKAPKEKKAEDDTPVVEEEKQVYLNPLTGTEIEKDKLGCRPVAIMINNISIAQPVQTGVNKADIVYETEVEGGITRLMAVFKDITVVNQLGPVRSARYPYVDLANGHNAVYIHCGQDPKYCAPHLKDIDDISIDTGKCGGTRISNGLSKEHTLYTFGDKLLSGIEKTNISTKEDNSANWQNFAEIGEELKFENAANSITVPFSASYHTVFNYDATKGKYTRSFGSTVRKDYVTGETTDVKNLFVLFTSIRDYSDRYHRQVYLESGNGYYFVNGTYTPINWSKGNTNNSFKFTDQNGNEIKVNAGNSWVCIADSGTSQPVIQ